MTQRNKSPLRPDIRRKSRTFDEGADNILRIIEENRKTLLEISAKLDAIIAHLKVPYQKPPIGFTKD